MARSALEAWWSFKILIRRLINWLIIILRSLPDMPCSSLSLVSCSNCILFCNISSGILVSHVFPVPSTMQTLFRLISLTLWPRNSSRWHLKPLNCKFEKKHSSSLMYTIIVAVTLWLRCSAIFFYIQHKCMRKIEEKNWLFFS